MNFKEYLLLFFFSIGQYDSEMIKRDEKFMYFIKLSSFMCFFTSIKGKKIKFL